MNGVDPRTPVLIGVAQWTGDRANLPGPEPLAAWERVCREALVDAGVGGDALNDVDALILTDCMSWRYDDPAARLAERLGSSASFRHVGPPSGTSGQTVVNLAVERIRSGETSAALVCGGEALASLKAYRQQGVTPPWSHVHPEGPGFWFDLDERQHPGESAVGLTDGIGAVYGFAMRDIARRAHLGISPAEYSRQLGETLSAMTEVAATNADAWFPQARSAEFLTEVRSDNRIIAYPYTKHMTAIIDVDMSVALLLCSEGWADARGVPQERRVYPWTSCYAEDPTHIAVRKELWKSPAMEAAAAATLQAAGLKIHEVRHIDVYSCFAAAVNFARDALGIPDRPGSEMTVTGGLPYAGGPASSYMLTSIAKMAARLRADTGAVGLVSGVGMMMSNHIYALYSATPPDPSLRQPDRPAVQSIVNQAPLCMIDDDYVGPAVVVTYTVMHDREGAVSHGAAICDLPSGARSYVRILDPAILEEAERTELVGRRVEIVAGEQVGTLARLC